MKHIVITGPTCSGKTAAGIRTAEILGGEIISADSRQIYRHMNIGTAKPAAPDRKRVPHHLIDILNPDERYGAADFKRDAEEKISEISSRGKHPVIVGGTGLYIKALVRGIFDGPAADLSLRAGLEEKAAAEGLHALHGELSLLDPESASKIHPNDGRRIIRALEIQRLTGKKPSELRRWTPADPRFLLLGLDPPRKQLYEAINERVDKMFREGFVEEVERLLSMGFKRGNIAMEAVGYRDIVDMLEGIYSLDQAKENIKAATRRYARRQLVWLRGEPGILWIRTDIPLKAEVTSDSIINLAEAR